MTGRNIFITGGAGFIGSHFVRHAIDAGDAVTVFDKLTYAGNMRNLPASGFHFIKGDLKDADFLAYVLREQEFSHVMHFAAESHVDRSISDPGRFVETNVRGTFNLLDALLSLGWARTGKKILHVSTDEVFGSLRPHDPAFTETTRYNPSSPYSASKAGSDHLARAYAKTYGLPVIVTHSSNNYGPFQHPEKLIPKMILACLHGEPLTIHGDGGAVRDWLHVSDHVRALDMILDRAAAGETFNIGGGCELSNLLVVRKICNMMDRLRPSPGLPFASLNWAHQDLIRHVEDRPGQDARYAVDTSRLDYAFGWAPSVKFDAGLADVVRWVIDNQNWWELEK